MKDQKQTHQTKTAPQQHDADELIPKVLFSVCTETQHVTIGLVIMQ